MKNQPILFAVGVGTLLLVSNLAISASSIAAQSPADPGVVNKERILYWMHKRGELTANASKAEKETALTHYLSGLGKAQSKFASAFTRARNPAKLTQAPSHVKASSKQFESKTVKVLAIMVDFPDLPHDANRLSAADTPMYYSDYSVAHYQDLMFNPSGFTGPSGQNLLSAHQYYQAESGASFSYTGQAYGWVRADHNAAFYGAHTGSGDNEEKDANAPALIKEAVSKAVATYGINLADYDVEDPDDYNGNGNLHEPDGIIDHVTIYHSSIGEEAGGGVVGKDAIWSHRFAVDYDLGGYTVPGTAIKLLGYTIQPIDAAAGVVSHEFGHDLGLPDEYDTASSAQGEPIGMWSIMSGGSWGGSLPGAQPTGFSPYAKDYFQQRYGGNWINQTTMTLSDLNSSPQSFALVEAVNHNTVNQLRVDVPGEQVAFDVPYQGSFQYYSGQGNNLDQRMSFTVTVPDSAAAVLKLVGRWDIETDYDYLQVLVNGNAIAGNKTTANNPLDSSVHYYLSGDSRTVSGAMGSLGWVNLSYSLAAFRNQTVTITFAYETDGGLAKEGFVADAIAISNGSNDIYTDDAELAGKTMLAGFQRTGNTRTSQTRHYYMQLRSYNGIDAGLSASSYDRGVVVWFADPNVEDNHVGEHPGHGFLGVVDADQIRSTGAYSESIYQVRDAPFGLLAQRSKSSDSSLTAIPSFDDGNDYAGGSQPQSGLVLPHFGLGMMVTSQQPDSSAASLQLSKADAPALAISFSENKNYLMVNFTSTVGGGTPAYTYLWNFGDSQSGNTANTSHTYANAGTYTATLTVTDSAGVIQTSSHSVTVSAAPSGGGSDYGSGGGGGSVSFTILALMILLMLRRYRIRRGRLFVS